MNSPENPQAAIATPKQSVVFNAWKKLLAKRKNSISIRVLCIVLISIATVFTWITQLLLEFMAALPDAVAETSSQEYQPLYFPDPLLDASKGIDETMRGFLGHRENILCD